VCVSARKEIMREDLKSEMCGCWARQKVAGGRANRTSVKTLDRDGQSVWRLEAKMWVSCSCSFDSTR
jgi:hypothetical protein